MSVPPLSHTFYNYYIPAPQNLIHQNILQMVEKKTGGNKGQYGGGGGGGDAGEGAVVWPPLLIVTRIFPCSCGGLGITMIMIA